MTRHLTRLVQLEHAIDGIVTSYGGSEEINSLESAALPNKRAVIEGFNHLKPVIYLGFYSTRSLNPTNLRHSLSEHLYPAYELLVEQIDRAVRYDEQVRGTTPPRSAGWSEEQVTEMAEVALALGHIWDHALGEDWRRRVDLDGVKHLYRRL